MTLPLIISKRRKPGAGRSPQDVLIIGRLFTKGIFDASRTIALTGSQINTPQYFKTLAGSDVSTITAEGGLKDGENRVISGNILIRKLPVKNNKRAGSTAG